MLTNEKVLEIFKDYIDADNTVSSTTIGAASTFRSNLILPPPPFVFPDMAGTFPESAPVPLR